MFTVEMDFAPSYPRFVVWPTDLAPHHRSHIDGAYTGNRCH